jgi:hypothetical protein
MITEPLTDPLFSIGETVYLASYSVPTICGEVQEMAWGGSRFGWSYCVLLESGQKLWAPEALFTKEQVPSKLPIEKRISVALPRYTYSPANEAALPRTGHAKQGLAATAPLIGSSVPPVALPYHRGRSYVAD